MDYTELMPTLEREQVKAQYEVSGFWPVAGLIDEMSVLFQHERDLDEYYKDFQKDGWEEQRFVCDTLSITTPGRLEGQVFGVTFHFWHHPDRTWRIEAMTHDSSPASPLHDHALALSRGMPTVIHASFKLPDRASYAQTLLKNPHPPVLSYENSYGQFSYYGTTAPYLKPRINTRDE